MHVLVAEDDAALREAIVDTLRFGGCTVNLVSDVMADQFAHAIRQRYQAKCGIVPEVLICRASGGASTL